MSTTTRNFTATLADDGGIEIMVNFNIETYLDTPAERHPDDPSTMQERYFESPEVKSIELVCYGVGVDVTNEVLEVLKKNPTKMTKLENDLVEYAGENYDDDDYTEE